MYSVVIKGLTIQCETPEDVFRLANANGAASNIAAPPMTMQQSTVPPPMTSAPMVQSVIPGLEESKWTEPAKTVIALLVQAGAEGLDTDRVAEAAGLKGPKGSAPLLRAAIELLAVGDNAIERPRTAEGKRRWVLTAKGSKAAARIGLLPHAEAGNQ
jgi:hypothetical protein